MYEVASEVLAQHGITLTQAAFNVGVGRRPLEAWRAVAQVLMGIGGVDGCLCIWMHLYMGD